MFSAARAGSPAKLCAATPVLASAFLHPISRRAMRSLRDIVPVYTEPHRPRARTAVTTFAASPLRSTNCAPADCRLRLQKPAAIAPATIAPRRECARQARFVQNIEANHRRAGLGGRVKAPGDRRVAGRRESRR